MAYGTYIRRPLLAGCHQAGRPLVRGAGNDGIVLIELGGFRAPGPPFYHHRTTLPQIRGVPGGAGGRGVAFR